ncbi:MAG: type IV toxin-antitoxin system AbiEi family antitoxin domain-containing protein [Deltaproteobacteria bacterium]|nr:type IV toxin-antitoxin system AbiEi family antitoxin domain-containing protein [Deltaproteobacteria bacterium]
MNPDPLSGLDRLPASFTYRNARRGGLSDRRLRRLVEEGVLRRLGRGVYRRAGAPPAEEDLVEVARRAPGGTLCLVTALARHGLTDRIPDRIDVALPRYRRPPRVEAPVRWHRFDAATYALGREEITVDDGARIGLYSPERCIVDAFRLRHREGEDLAVEALRAWLRRPGAVPSALLALAGSFPRAEPALREALRILL